MTRGHGGSKVSCVRLLLDHPLWIVLIVVTIAVHVGFFVGVKRVLGKPDE